MGTNYYFRKRGFIPLRNLPLEEKEYSLHIGKSSYGWHFALHVYPELGINTLEDWKKLFRKKITHYIRDEYNRNVSVKEMINIITNRSYPTKTNKPIGYTSAKDFHEKNHSEEGLNNLVRSKIDNRFCIGHGEGTWDYMIGEFS